MSKILVVDDQAVERDSLRTLLEEDGHAVVEARNGAEAISVLADSLPDLIISDIFMPIIDGFMLCREVRRNPHSTRIPFLFRTATFTSRDDEKLAYEVGGAAYLRKSGPSDELLSLIHRLTADETQSPAAVTTADAPSDLDRKYAAALLRKLTEKSSELEAMRRTLETERDWGSILKRIRRARGLKQAALGELLGVDQSRISRWESNRENPNIGAQKILLDFITK